MQASHSRPTMTPPRRRLSGVLIPALVTAILATAATVVADEVSVAGPDDCLSDADPCGEAVVTFDRTSTEPLRGLSVTFELSPEIALCTGDPAVDITVASGAGALFEGYSNLEVQRLDLGGGQYTVDLALLGAPCGPDLGGDVFTIAVTRAPGQTGSVSGTIAVTEVVVRDCANMPLPGEAGASGQVSYDGAAPAPVTDLAATQVTAGNDADGTTLIDLAWTAPTEADADYVEIWRKGFGDYPEYDDGTGAAPAPPVTTDNGWTLAATLPATDAVYTDDPGARDFWTYAIRVVDACGNPSEITAGDLTSGTLSYHLGDVRDPDTPGAEGDNAVDVADISALGAAYGTSDGDAAYENALDVGPTTDFAVRSRPLTDDQIQFEDLIVLATNYELVGRIEAPGLEPMPRNEILVKVAPAAGSEATLVAEIILRGNGRIQGLSVPLKWNPDAVRPVGMVPGDLVDRQGGPGLVLAAAPGVVDAALLGVRDHGIRGQGTLARVTFEVVGDGAPRITTGRIDARDAGNRPLPVDVTGHDVLDDSSAGAERSTLHANTPNPFNPSTTLAFRIEESGRVRLGVFDVRGRLVRSLVDGQLPVGDHAIAWHGRNDAGELVSSGTYFVRLMAPDRSETRTITLVK
ncbi:hypothetical protein GF314_10220 [bacterium]|nr:hypothetical protein [bacterium]